MEKSLVDILLEHNNTFHRGQNGWSSETWNVMVKLFLSRHPYLRMEKSQIQDKEKDLKRDYRMLKEARMQSGVGWDESQFKLQAEPHLWENLEISFGTRIKRFKTKAFPLYDSLGQLYEGSIAEGNFNFTSTSTTSREDLTQVISDDDEPEGDTEADIPERESEDEYEVMDPAPSAQSMTQVEHQVKGKRVAAARNKLPKIPKRSPKKRNSDGIVQVMERMVQVREKEVNQEQPLQKFSITRCMDALKTLDGMTGSIKIPALDVFRIADNREIFLNLVDDKDDKDGTAMTWLLGQIAKLP
ncbi:uncharacterized protein [Lolium perenne]|uniref:uncharacterized protein n=1 Tax=Lolium perenne TaxID=4522 RepID=UPI003A99968A